MAIVLTSFQAYGIEAEEAVNKRYKQVAILSITAANTDVDIDLGDIGSSPGTFWNAADATSIGLTGLAAFRDIARRAQSFVGVGGTGIAGYVQADASAPLIQTLDSAASSGGNASETLTVTGLLTTDTLLSVTQFVAGASSEALSSWGGATGVCSTNDQLDCGWDADPGAGAKVRVLFSRTSTAVVAGTYQLSMDSTYAQMPNILFVTGNAPTAYTIQLEWVLKAGEAPVEVYA